MDDETNGPGAIRLVVEGLLATAVALAIALRFDLASAWLLVAVAATLAARRPLHDLAIEPRLSPPSLPVHLLLGAGLLCAYAAAHVAFAVWVADAEFAAALPPDLAILFLHHLLVVAIPEEVFFRGYLQSTFNRAFPTPRCRLAGAAFGIGIWLQAVVFGACHLATGDWTRLRVVLFGLLAGWLRSRSGSLAAPVLYHAVANVAVAIVETSLH